MNTKLKTVIMFSGTLVIGILIGVIADSLFRAEREQKFWRLPPQERISSILKVELDLNEKQESRIDSILASHFPPPKPVQIMSDPTLLILRRLEEEITPVLNDTQKKKFSERMEIMSINSIAMRVAMLKEYLHLTDKQQQQLTQLFSEKEKQIKKGPIRILSFHDSLPSIIGIERRNYFRDSLPGRIGEGRVFFPRDSLQHPGMRIFFDSTQKELESILTPEQLRKFQMRPHGIRE